MNIAIILSVSGCLPAHSLVTRNNLRELGFVLPEVKSFLGKYVHSNRELEIFVREFTITVDIELLPNAVEVFLFKLHAPEPQKVDELVLIDVSISVGIDVHKSTSDRFPLELDFFKDLVLKTCHSAQGLCGFFFILVFSHGLFFKLLLVICILD